VAIPVRHDHSTHSEHHNDCHSHKPIRDASQDPSRDSRRVLSSVTSHVPSLDFSRNSRRNPGMLSCELGSHSGTLQGIDPDSFKAIRTPKVPRSRALAANTAFETDLYLARPLQGSLPLSTHPDSENSLYRVVSVSPRVNAGVCGVVWSALVCSSKRSGCHDKVRGWLGGADI
jgi:hypothetical protein